MAAPLNTCTTREQRGIVRFLWAKIWKQRISTKKCCPCTVNIACHIRQSIIGCRSSRKGGQVLKTNIEPVGQWRSPRRKRCSASKTSSKQRRVTVNAVATTIGCSRGQAYNTMHEALGFHKVCSRWVPCQGCCCCLTMPVLIVPIRPQRR